MKYYIDPSWIYWINTINSLRIVFITLTFLSVIVSIMGLVTWISGDMEDNIFKKGEIIPVSIFIISLLVVVFVPSKQVLIEMEIAKLATKENIQLTVDSLKEITDYVVNAITALK